MQTLTTDQNETQEVVQLDCKIDHCDHAVFMESLKDDSVDLILTDPPYCISRKTGFSSVGKKSVKRFAVSMDFGDWDHSEINLGIFTEHAYKKIKSSGTIIVFYDLWKLTHLAEELMKAGFVQLRLIEWIKSNPVPLNSKKNYLTNSREIAVSAVKKGKPTFHGEYDNGQYKFPIPNNGSRFHPTQKPIELFRELIKKHSNINEVVVDPFLGSGTTAVAALNEGRRFMGCEINKNYVKVAKERVRNETQQE